MSARRTTASSAPHPSAGARPAFYAPRGIGLARDLVALLHPPYTAWHLSYVALGAAAASHFDLSRLGWALGGFFLAVGIGAHALDELHGRPLRTRLSDRTLIVLGALGLGGAVAIGVAGAIAVSATLVPFILVGALLVLVYNLELLGGRFHGQWTFALGWGGFPALTGFWICALQFEWSGLLVAAACTLLSLAQRRLSLPVRELRRKTVSVVGEQRLSDGRTVELTAARLLAPLEGTLRVLWFALVLLAAGLVVLRA